jgi:hypothetical protein
MIFSETAALFSGPCLGLANGCVFLPRINIAFAEMVSDFFESSLLPLLRLGQPENSALKIEGGPFSAHRLLIAYLDQPIHDPTPWCEANSQ